MFHAGGGPRSTGAPRGRPAQGRRKARKIVRTATPPGGSKHKGVRPPRHQASWCSSHGARGTHKRSEAGPLAGRRPHPGAIPSRARYPARLHASRAAIGARPSHHDTTTGPAAARADLPTSAAGRPTPRCPPRPPAQAVVPRPRHRPHMLRAPPSSARGIPGADEARLPPSCRRAPTSLRQGGQLVAFEPQAWRAAGRPKLAGEVLWPLQPVSLFRPSRERAVRSLAFTQRAVRS